MESLVVNLETARKLKAAGFGQETSTYFVWWDTVEGAYIEAGKDAARFADFSKAFAAPLAQELADQLPNRTELHKVFHPDADMAKAGYLYRATLFDDEGYQLNLIAPTIAEALASLYLKVHEVKHG